MNVLWETMVDESRAWRAELDSRRHFTPEKQPIEHIRGVLDDQFDDTPVDLQRVATGSAMGLRQAADQNLIEVE